MLYVLYGSAVVPDTGLKLPVARVGTVSLESTSQKYSGSNTDRQLYSINLLVGNLASTRVDAPWLLAACICRSCWANILEVCYESFSGAAHIQIS